MKYTLIFSFLLILVCSCQKTKDIPTNNEADFLAVETLIQDAFDGIWSAQNAELLLKYHTEDFLLLEHGEVWNNDTILNWIKQTKERNKDMIRINSFDVIGKKKEGNRIWMAYHNYATLKLDTIERKAQWLESAVAVKQDSVWKLEMLHSTRVNRKND